MKKNLKTCRFPTFYILASLALAVSSGCATGKKSSEPLVERSLEPISSVPSPLHITPEATGPAESSGPPSLLPFSPLAPPSMVYGPDPIQKRSVVIVLGPGLARGYSYVGILRALKEQKIPVGAILGTEMGGLIAALYGMSANLNQFEWGLLKLGGDDNFRPSKSFFRKNMEQVNNGAHFEKTLRQVFGTQDLSQAKIPIRIAIQSQITGLPIILDHGNVVQAVRAALAAPSLFPPGILSTEAGNIPAVSAGGSRPYLVHEARSLGLGPTIVIDAMSGEEDAFASSELSSADLVIRPDLAGIDYMEFQKKTEVAFRGKKAVLQNLTAIKRLIGLVE